MQYVEGFVAAVPTVNLEAFREHALKTAVAFRDRGALKVVECWGTDVPDGQLTSLPKAVACKSDETVTFSWVVWPSKEVRDSGMKNIMDDPRFNPDTNPMPFDGKRMIFGGFEVMVDE